MPIDTGARTRTVSSRRFRGGHKTNLRRHKSNSWSQHAPPNWALRHLNNWVIATIASCEASLQFRIPTIAGKSIVAVARAMGIEIRPDKLTIHWKTIYAPELGDRDSTAPANKKTPSPALVSFKTSRRLRHSRVRDANISCRKSFRCWVRGNSRKRIYNPS